MVSNSTLENLIYIIHLERWEDNAYYVSVEQVRRNDNWELYLKFKEKVK